MKSKSRRVWLVLLVAFGLLAGAGIASAADGDPDDDTQLNFGYDDVNHVLLVSTSPTDSPHDCSPGDEILTTQYDTPDEDGRVPVLMLLHDNGDVVKFAFRAPEDVGSDYTPADADLDYPGAEGPCAVSGGVVGGEQGQVNHGQVMKTFHELIDMQGMGCLNRIIAQSDLGKDDQQIRTSDVDENFEVGDSGMVQFTTETADCEHGKKDKDEDGPAAANSQGKKDKDVGPSGSRGNSGNAPGHNK